MNFQGGVLLLPTKWHNILMALGGAAEAAGFGLSESGEGAGFLSFEPAWENRGFQALDAFVGCFFLKDRMYQ